MNQVCWLYAYNPRTIIISSRRAWLKKLNQKEQGKMKEGREVERKRKKD